MIRSITMKLLYEIALLRVSLVFSSLFSSNPSERFLMHGCYFHTRYRFFQFTREQFFIRSIYFVICRVVFVSGRMRMLERTFLEQDCNFHRFSPALNTFSFHFPLRYSNFYAFSRSNVIAEDCNGKTNCKQRLILSRQCAKALCWSFRGNRSNEWRIFHEKTGANCHRGNSYVNILRYPIFYTAIFEIQIRQCWNSRAWEWKGEYISFERRISDKNDI